MSKAEKPLTFEQALERLEGLVESLDGGELALEESLRRFEEGVRLARLCSERLDSADLRVRTLADGVDGPAEQPFEAQEEK